MAAIDISPAKDGGVLKEILKEGTGDETPIEGDQVTVHYTGTLLDGTKFDSSRDRNEPFKFPLGLRHVIKAWDIGIATMKKGEIAMLTCAPKYAYGKAGFPPTIPPNATLKFEIEMIDWEREDLSPDKDGSIERQVIVAGEGYISPTIMTLVNIHLTGTYNGQIFEDRDVMFHLGEGDNHGIVEGVEIALEHFKNKEKSKLKIKSKYAFKEIGNPKFNIPPNADVEYIVELNSFEKLEQMWSMSGEKRIEQAKLLKEKANSSLKINKYSLAITLYEKAKEFLKDDRVYENQLDTERKSVLLSLHLNLALCHLKHQQNVKAKNECEEALKLDPQNEKAHFRIGQAHLALASPEIAIKNFEKVLQIEPKNVAATKQIMICNDLIKKQQAKDRKLYANMFDKFAREDKQKEEEQLRQQPDVMHGTVGEWGQEERPGGRDATAFEKENPNILMLNANGTGEFQNM